MYHMRVNPPADGKGEEAPSISREIAGRKGKKGKKSL